MDKRKIVGYCRVSTLEQKKKGFGIDIQIRDVEGYADANGITINRYYIDKAESGIEEDRKELRKLLKNCKAGKIKGVIVASLDRLSRDLRLTENLLYDLEKLGVKVFIADMPTYDGSNRKDVLIRQIREAIAEENRKEIIERLKKGREERIRKGKPPGGTIAYGYVRSNGELKKNPQEVKIIKAIYNLATQGKRGQGIANYLNNQGFKRRNGTPWTQRQVWTILNRCDLYKKGIFKYGKVTGKNKKLIIFR